ncbi:hypothetical protein Btru_065492 [Bulinus truncatus]|nr:hypothetical protein Btru_065492 [Bulinus truncatus]
MFMMNDSIDKNQEVDGKLVISGYQIISDVEREIYEVVTLVFISSAIGLFGVISNIINMVIFVKMGLNNTVNIGFMGLAISDLLCLVTIEWYCISFNPLFINSDVNFFPPDVQHLSAGVPHGCFARITAWVTAYITFERCLCITAPLKVKQILTPRRTIIILILIYFIVMLPLLPEYATAYVGLKYFPYLNKTLYGLMFTSDRYKVDGLSFLLYAVLMFVSFLAVIVFTAILVVKLHEKSQWRQKSTFDNGQSETLSRRDKSTIKTVILIATILIVNFSPTVAFLQESQKKLVMSESLIITDGEREIYEVVTLVFISSAIGLFGLISNITNMVIFVKMGLNNTVNIGFMGLAISDLLCLVTIEWYCICFNPLFINSNINFFPPDVQHLSGGHPHGCFARITAWVTVYITFERCLCIIAPLKVKQILTPRRTIIILILIYFIVILPILPEYATAYVGMKYFPHLNKTLYGLLLTSDRYKVDGLSFLLYAVLMFVSFLAVIVFTAILVVKLHEKSQWRQKSTFDNGQSETLSRRDKSTIKTVILIATILIVNFSPTVAFFTGVFIVPEFSITGRHRNLFLVSAAFCFIFDTINSSVNILSYYTMSSKYRQCFQELFSFCYKEKDNW